MKAVVAGVAYATFENTEMVLVGTQDVTMHETYVRERWVMYTHMHLKLLL